MADVHTTESTTTYYDQITGHPLVQQAYATYDWAKRSNPYLESTLENVEQRVSGVAQAANEKVTETYNSYYVRPKDAFSRGYNTGVENSRWALETGKSAVVQTGTLALGAAVLGTQLGLQLSVGGANLVMDGAGAVAAKGKGVVNSVRQMEQAVEERIWATISEAQRLAMVPVDKASETTHSILDIVNALLERAWNINIPNTPETSIKDRVKNISHAVASTLTSRVSDDKTLCSNKLVKEIKKQAHEQVIDPVQERTRILLEHLSKSFVLVDVVRSKKEWALEKMEELSASVSDLKHRFEAEAKEYGTKPEEVLMRSIRNKSQQLREQLETLKGKGQQMFGDGTRVENAITYLQDLDGQLSQADDIYQVRDEVLAEASQRLAELTQWTTNIFLRRQQHNNVD